MRLKMISVAALAATALVVAAAALAAPQKTITLRGSVGPGYTITLTDHGQKVKSLPAGTYKFVVADRARVHNFVLEKEHGGRFEKELTDVSDMGVRTVTIELTRGTWKYYCEPHETMMSGTFKVT
jgi:plastocyanin